MPRRSPPPACEAALVAWCDINCPLPMRPLWARMDTNVQGGPAMWRCYAAEALTPDRRRYSSGPSYCTRHEGLRMQLQACMRTIEEQRHAAPQQTSTGRNGPQTTVTVDPMGGTRTVPARAPPPAPSPPPVAEVTVDLVVAHCNEDMPWLEEVQKGLVDGFEERPDAELVLLLHVYEKCGNEQMPWVRTGWAREERTLLANKGEECFAFLTHLASRYEQLGAYLLFFQGDGVLAGKDFRSKARSFSTGVISPGVVDVWRSVNDHQYITFASSLAECDAHDAGPLPNCHNGVGRQWACAEQLFQRNFPEPPPAAFGMYTNAQFGVSRDRVRARPLSFYRGLLAEFEGESEDECYRIVGPKGRPFRGTCALLEYMWPTIMGEEPVLRSGKTMSGREAWGCIRVSERPGPAALPK